jgi:5'-3' exonuclease
MSLVPKKPPNKVLFDGDIITYRLGFAYENEPLSLCLWNVNDSINSRLAHLDIPTYSVFLTSSDKSNFRFGIKEDYKGNRKARKPLHYEEIRRHLIEKHNAEVVRGIEADDAIAIAQSSSGGDTVICSVDKDFRQVPGWHFHFVRKELDWISWDEAESFFWQQVITGDGIDNVVGIKGYGPKKSHKWLEVCSTTREYLGAVRRLYLEHYGEFEGDSKLVDNINLLRLRRTADEPLITLADIEASLNGTSPLYSNQPELVLATKPVKSRSRSRKRKEPI